MSEARTELSVLAYDAEIRRYMEQQAGLVLEGPDTDSIEFTLNGKQHKVNYVVIDIGGLTSQEQARNEIIRYVMSREFLVLGNPIRLQRSVASGPSGLLPPAEEGYPQGPILVWRRDGGMPHYHCSDTNVWDIHAAYAVLPPFVDVQGADYLGSGEGARQVDEGPTPRTPRRG